MKKKQSESFDLEEYLKKGVEKTVLSIAKASVFHPSQAAFAAGFALSAKKAGSKRKALAAEGKHGAYTVFDIAPRYLMPCDAAELRAHML